MPRSILVVTLQSLSLFVGLVIRESRRRSSITCNRTEWKSRKVHLLFAWIGITQKSAKNRRHVRWSLLVLSVSRELCKVARTTTGSSISTESISLVVDRASVAMKLETPGIYIYTHTHTHTYMRRHGVVMHVASHRGLWRRMRI